MRIITRRKIYRAFPELDRFSDEQCREYIRRVRLSQLRELALFLSLLFVGVGSLMGAVHLTRTILDSPDERRLQVELIVRGMAWAYVLGWVVYLFLVAATPCLLTLLTRDIVLGAFLKQALHGHLKRTACPGCRYQLLGLPLGDAGAVRCPECGRRTTILELGLDGPEDLLPAAGGHTVS
jgi:hypothetical protein